LTPGHRRPDRAAALRGPALGSFATGGPSPGGRGTSDEALPRSGRNGLVEIPSEGRSPHLFGYMRPMACSPSGEFLGLAVLRFDAASEALAETGHGRAPSGLPYGRSAIWSRGCCLVAGEVSLRLPQMETPNPSGTAGSRRRSSARLSAAPCLLATDGKPLASAPRRFSALGARACLLCWSRALGALPGAWVGALRRLGWAVPRPIAAGRLRASRRRRASCSEVCPRSPEVQGGVEAQGTRRKGAAQEVTLVMLTPRPGLPYTSSAGM
jgi:hypothetical protein